MPPSGSAHEKQPVKKETSFIHFPIKTGNTVNLSSCRIPLTNDWIFHWKKSSFRDCSHLPSTAKCKGILELIIMYRALGSARTTQHSEKQLSFLWVLIQGNKKTALSFEAVTGFISSASSLQWPGAEFQRVTLSCPLSSKTKIDFASDKLSWNTM